MLPKNVSTSQPVMTMHKKKKKNTGGGGEGEGQHLKHLR